MDYSYYATYSLLIPVPQLSFDFDPSPMWTRGPLGVIITGTNNMSFNPAQLHMSPTNHGIRTNTTSHLFKTQRYKGPTYGLQVLFLFLAYNFANRRNFCYHAPPREMFRHISQFWRHHHNEILWNLSHLMHNIGNQYHWFWASQYHFHCFR